MRGPRSRLIAVLAVLVLYAFHDELVKPMPAGILREKVKESPWRNMR